MPNHLPHVLVFSGGGMKGYFLPPAILVAKRFGLLKDIHTVAGTSIGAFVAAMYCLYEPEELIQMFMMTDFSGMVSEMKITNFTSHGWLSDGEWLESYISSCIMKKTGKEDVTLQELYDLCKIKLIMNTIYSSSEDEGMLLCS